MSSINRLADWLANGGNRVGELAITPSPEGGYRLTHWDDRAAAGLTLYTTPEDARALAIYDDAGEFRPLRSAPNLRHGWVLELPALASLALAIDYFYPAARGVWSAWKEGRLARIPLRDTLNRQSGMYTITKKASDETLNQVIASCCNTASGCLKAILWEVAPQQPVTALPATKFTPEGSFPLLCNEGCNLLVGAIRAEMKKAG